VEVVRKIKNSSSGTLDVGGINVSCYSLFFGLIFLLYRLFVLVEKSATRVVDIQAAPEEIHYSADGSHVLVRERGEGDGSDTVSIFDGTSGELRYKAVGTQIGLGPNVSQMST
jgi:hypothetical protein